MLEKNESFNEDFLKEYSGEKTAISLFSGCGGDTLGLEKAGFKVIGFVEFWKKAIESHRLNFPNSVLIGEEFGGDITKIEDFVFKKYENKIDVLFAGFPCQGFSHAGKKNPNDKRNEMFWEFVRIAKIIKPKWVIGENVSGLIHRKSPDGVKIKNIIIKAFEDIGYNMANPVILKAEDYNIPQKRRRVFFVGNKNGLDFKFPKPKKDKNNPPSIRKLIEKEITNSTLFNLDLKIPSNKIIKLSKNPPNGGKPHPYLKLKLKNKLVSFSKRISPYHIEISDLDKPTKTIHCGYAFQPRLFTLLKKNEDVFIREFNLRELAQIQGFPKKFLFSGSKEEIITQIGNAVPPPLVEEIAKKIINTDNSLQNPPFLKISAK